MDKNYVISIIESNSIKNINLNDFKKQEISFGRNDDNDIIIDSPIVSGKHGSFIITDNGIEVIDNNSTNGLYINNEKINKATLNDGDFIKIDNLVEPLKKGVVLVLSTDVKEIEWKQYDLLEKDKVTIGRDSKCDIVVNHVSVSLVQALITRNNDKFIINSKGNNNGIIINGKILNGSVSLTEKDVMLIANTKFIYNKGRLIYQTYDKGVSVEAIDIVKTVKVKGKKRNISEHINLSIKAGEFVSLVGGSGAGKSTFMHCINGVSKPTSGKVLVNGCDLYQNYSVLKNIIGYVPQQDIVFTDLTLIDMLKYAADLRMSDDATEKEKANRIDEVLDIVELSDKKDVMIRNLSGGQKKRASIAVELIADPKLFFLDEPTSGLDPGTERSIMKTLRKMADLGKTIILVTHTTLNLHLCDKIVFLGVGGKLCFAGSPKDALDFFKVDDFVDIYTMLNSDTDTWYKEFEKNNNFNRNISVSEEQTFNIKNNKKSFFKQFFTLSKRYMKTIINNKQQMMLLFLQAPICAYLLSLVVSSNLFSNYDETKTILFALATTSIWLGLLNSIQEICKERVILAKEYMANLKLSSYIASKTFVQSLLGLIQAFLLVTLFCLFVGDIPKDGIVFSWYFEMLLTCFLTINSASAMGLVVSTVAKNPSVAMTFAPLLLVPQLLFSGMLFKLEGVKEVISNFILCRWSVEAFGTSVNLNSLPNSIEELLPGYSRELEHFYTFTSDHFFSDIGMIVIMMIVLLIACYVILKMQLKKK